MLGNNKRITEHNVLKNLAYNNSGHTGFQKLTKIITTAPDKTFDSDAGYNINDLIYNSTKKALYICVDNSENAAIWNSILSFNSMQKSDIMFDYFINNYSNVENTILLINGYYNVTNEKFKTRTNGTANRGLRAYIAYDRFKIDISNIKTSIANQNILTNIFTYDFNYKTLHIPTVFNDESNSANKVLSISSNGQIQSIPLSILKVNSYNGAVQILQLFNNFGEFSDNQLIQVNSTGFLKTVNPNYASISPYDGIIRFPAVYNHSNSADTNKLIRMNDIGELYSDSIETKPADSKLGLLMNLNNDIYTSDNIAESTSKGLQYNSFSGLTNHISPVLACWDPDNILTMETSLPDETGGNAVIIADDGHIHINTSSIRKKIINDNNFTLSDDEINKFINISQKKYNYITDSAETKKSNQKWMISPITEELHEAGLIHLINYGYLHREQLKESLKACRRNNKDFNMTLNEYVKKYKVNSKIIKGKTEYLLPLSINQPNYLNYQSLVIKKLSDKINKNTHDIDNLNTNLNKLINLISDE